MRLEVGEPQVCPETTSLPEPPRGYHIRLMELSIPQVASAEPTAFDSRRRTADRVFTGALLFNAALTLFWLVQLLGGRTTRFFQDVHITVDSLGRIGGAVVFFYILWGFIWWGIKAALLKYVAGLSREERRAAFSSRMTPPGFDVSAILQRHSERRIRIIDMIGRRGRFMTLMMPGFYYLYTTVAADPTPAFATLFLSEHLFDAVVTSWISLAFFYGNGWLAAAFYGPQSRIMDGVLARANCLLIMTLWTAFKFVMVPLGGLLVSMFPPQQFAILFALIWGSYIAADAFSEIGGALYGRQTLRVWGIGDVNRKSVGGTVTGFVASLALSVGIVVANGLPGSWLVLALVIAISNTVLELFSPRGTDDFTMATVNALICCLFGLIIT